MTVVCIVTPSFNSARFISQTIQSVTSQSGDFDLYYHVQDGGSSDSTCAIVKDHIDRVAGGHDTACRSITMTMTSAPDDGMYDAINKGFSALPIDDAILMTWINSDDLLCSGAISAVLAVASQFQVTKWLGGRIVQIDAHGTVLSVHPPYLYPTALIAQGLCDGRSGRFIQQEGVFWTPDLWERVGGLDANFKLAGDWDLWRRFAQFAAFDTVDTLTGFHRRHPGQLSADLTDYRAEVDSAEPVVSGPARPTHQPTYYRYDHAKAIWKASNSATRVEDVTCLSSAAETIFASAKVTTQAPAYRVHGPAIDTYLALISSTPVAAGENVEACVSVCLYNDAQLSVRLVRHDETAAEGSPHIRVDVKRGDNIIRVRHTFKHAHGGYRVQIASVATPALISNVRFVQHPPSDLSPLHNAFMGKRCFVVGDDPSLSEIDLGRLVRDHVFVCNDAVRLFERNDWRPDFYACSESRVLRDSAPDIVAMLDANPDVIAFFPSELVLDDGTGRAIDTHSVIPPAPNRYYFYEVANALASPPESAFSLDANMRVVQPFSRPITLLQLAAYMGFNPIYLLGCGTSCEMATAPQQQGRKVGGDGRNSDSTDECGPNHRDSRSSGNGRERQDTQVGETIEHYGYAKQVLDGAGIAVFNATTDSRLEIYPSVDFKSLF